MATYAAAKLFDPTAVGTSIGIIYTAPGSTTVKVAELLIANTTASNITINLYMVPYGGTAGSANLIGASIPIPGNSTMQWEMSQILASGDFIAASASAAGVLIRGSGVAIT